MYRNSFTVSQVFELIEQAGDLQSLQNVHYMTFGVNGDLVDLPGCLADRGRGSRVRAGVNEVLHRVTQGVK